MKKSTLGLVVCLVITVIISVVAVVSEKKAKAERDAYLISQKHNERRERCNYGGDEMHEPPVEYRKAYKYVSVKGVI